MPVTVFPPAYAGISWSAIAGNPYDNAALREALDAPRLTIREIVFQKRGQVSADPASNGVFLPVVVTSACRIAGVYSKLGSGSAACSIYVNGAPATAFQNFPVTVSVNSTAGNVELNAGDLLGIKVESTSNSPEELSLSIKIASLAEVAR